MLMFRSIDRPNTGFTVIELLIVIVVIAILTVLTFATYTGIQTRANTSAIMSDLEQIAKACEMYRITNGTYIHADANDPWDKNAVSQSLRTGLQSFPLKISSQSYRRDTNNLIYIASVDGEKWALFAAVQGGTGWYVSNDQLTPKQWSPKKYAINVFPGSAYGDLANELDIPYGQSVFWNIYDKNSGTFRAWT